MIPAQDTPALLVQDGTGSLGAGPVHLVGASPPLGAKATPLPHPYTPELLYLNAIWQTALELLQEVRGLRSDLATLGAEASAQPKPAPAPAAPASWGRTKKRG